MPVLDEFIAGWAGVLRRWRAEVNMSCSRLDLYTFVEILDGWFGDPAMPGIFRGPAHKLVQPQHATACRSMPQHAAACRSACFLELH